MSQINFTIIGVPVPKGRPRFHRCKNFVMAYTPKKTHVWECSIRVQARQHKPEIPWQGPISMALTFMMPRPKSLPKKVIHHIKKPDLDNLAKSIKDALQGVIYKTDSQIIILNLEKKYTLEEYGVAVRMEEIGVDDG